MNSTLFLLKSINMLIILVIATIGGLSGAYLLPKPAVSCPSVIADTTMSETVKTKLEIITQKLSELQTDYQTITQAIQNQAKSSTQFQENLLNKLQLIESNLNNALSRSTISATTTDAHPPLLNESLQQIAKNIDPQAIPNALRDIHSTDYNTRLNAFTTLMSAGSVEAKQQVMDVIFNKDEDIRLRRDLIQRVPSWQGYGKTLVDLLQNDKENYAIRATAMDALENTKLDETEKNYHETALKTKFESEDNDIMRTKTLNYFKNHDKAVFDELVRKIDPQKISPEFRENLQLLSTPEQEIPVQ
jgi:hypothetical protein